MEYYFGKQDMLTATTFYRQIDGYIQSKNDQETYGTCGSPPVACVYTVNRPYNSGQGYLEGFEVGYQQWFDMLPGIWSGLGLQTNGTFIEGPFQRPSDGCARALSERLEILLQSCSDVRIRPSDGSVSYNWRSSFQVGYTFSDSTSVNPPAAYSKPYGELGMSVNYTMNEHLVFTFDANNLMDSNYQDHFGQGAYAAIYPRDTRHYDQNFTLGLRYKM